MLMLLDRSFYLINRIPYRATLIGLWLLIEASLGIQLLRSRLLKL